MAADLVTADGQPITQQPQQFPAVNFNLSPDGMKITILLGPGLSLTQEVPPAYLDEIARRWREIKSDVQRIQSLANHALKTKAR